MLDEFQTTPTRRRALWMAPLGLTALGAFWVRRKILAPEPLPSANTGEDITLIDFADDGTRRGEVHTKKLVRSDTEWFTRLTPQQYYVTRKHSTDTPYT